MASFREHITFSAALGVGYGCLAHFYAGYTPQQGALAGCLAGIGGMLPDLDLPTGRPGREIFSLTAAVAPLILVGRVLRVTQLPKDTETTMLCVVAMYLVIRYGLAEVVKRLSTHRGMFHSVPSMVIAGQLVYLGYPSNFISVKLLMGLGVALGFLSHLLLDEIWSFTWKGGLPSLKKSSGTAIKMFGEQFLPNAVTFALLATTSFFMLEDLGLIERSPTESSTAQTDSDEIVPPAAAATIREVELPPELRSSPARNLGDAAERLQTPDLFPSLPTEFGTPGSFGAAGNSSGGAERPVPDPFFQPR